MIESAQAAPPPREGRVTRTLLGWLMRPAQIVGITTLSPRIRLIDLAGDALRDIDWTAGQKIQMSTGAGLTTRTYTPMAWDAERGTMRLLAFSHGAGPGSRWAADVRQGDMCRFFGPRRSLDLAEVEGSIVLFGDETSFGLGAALRDAMGSDASCVFEVSDAVAARPVLERIGIGDATVIERVTDDAHLAAAADRLSRRAASDACFVLTGKASSIQHIGRALKTRGVGSSRIKAKAYWAAGKTGLD